MKFKNRETSLRTELFVGAGAVLVFAYFMVTNVALAGGASQNLARFENHMAQEVDYMTRSELKADYLIRERLDYEAAPIHSKRQLAEYLAQTAHVGSPLDVLPSSARKRFLSNLVFSRGTVGSLDMVDLYRLSPVQVYKILALFGVQYATAEIIGPKAAAVSGAGDALKMSPSPYSDHAGYACLIEPDKQASHTCFTNTEDICMSGC